MCKFWTFVFKCTFYLTRWHLSSSISEIPNICFGSYTLIYPKEFVLKEPHYPLSLWSLDMTFAKVFGSKKVSEWMTIFLLFMGDPRCVLNQLSTPPTELFLVNHKPAPQKWLCRKHKSLFATRPILWPHSVKILYQTYCTIIVRCLSFPNNAP